MRYLRYLRYKMRRLLYYLRYHPMAAYPKQVLRYYLYGKAKNTLPELLINRLHPVHSGKDLIRLGPKGDGGYLVPDDLAGIEACFSPGIGMISGFEDDCAKQGMKVFMADGSVNELPSSHRLFDFTKKHLGITTNSDFITLDDWVTQSLPDSQNDLLLQMDIEGAEYDVLANTSDQLLSRFRIIAIEFHGLGNLWRKPFLERVLPVFNKILQTHSCVHAHPNNCRLL